MKALLSHLRLTAAILAMAAVSVSPLLWASDAKTEDAAPERPVVVVETSRGDIVIELYPDRAPLTVENFLAYVDDGFYDGTVVHRASRKIIALSGVEADGTQRPTRDPIRSEADNGLFHDRGTVGDVAHASRPQRDHRVLHQSRIEPVPQPSLARPRRLRTRRVRACAERHGRRRRDRQDRLQALEDVQPLAASKRPRIPRVRRQVAAESDE